MCEEGGVVDAFVHAAEMANRRSEYCPLDVTAAFLHFATTGYLVCRRVCEKLRAEHSPLGEEKLQIAKSYAEVFKRYRALDIRDLLDAHRREYEAHLPDGRGGCRYRQCLQGPAVTGSEPKWGGPLGARLS
jgi:hypothetical protein